MKPLALALLPCLALPAASQTPQAVRGEAAESQATGDDEVTAQVEAVILEYRTAHDEWYEEYLATQGAAEVMKAMPQPEPYAPRLLALASKAPRSEGAFTACAWVITTLRTGEPVTAAIAHAADHLLQHPRIGELVPEVRGGEEPNNRFLAGVAEHATSNEVAARASYNLAAGLKDRLFRTESPEEAKRLEAMADEYFAKCQAEPYADVVLQGDVKIGDKAAADVFEMKNLRVGKVAPDIDGEDIEGVPFKLSDYRGKVVMLDFWGDW